MRQHHLDVLQFRTPQHPSQGTNNWGGASPLLARNVPQESLDQRYQKLNTTRTRDEVFPVIDEADYLAQFYDSKNEVLPPTPSGQRRGILLKLLFPPRRRRKQEVVTLGSVGSRKIRRWFGFCNMDSRNRWPNGWC